jgi:type IV pilus assembly protein PilN
MIKINLAPPLTRQPERGAPGINLGLVFGALGAVVIVVVGAFAWLLSAEVEGLRRDIEQSQAEITRLKPIIAEGQRYRAEKEELERRVNAIETVARNQPRPTYFLDALADVLPGGLWLTRVEEKAQQLKLNGSTYPSVALSDFMANLKSSGKFKEVDLVESRQDLTKSPRTITFEVTCRFEI